MPRATRTIEAGGLTSTQRLGLTYLGRAYEVDVPVSIEQATAWADRCGASTPEGIQPKVTVSRSIANRLQFAGLASITPQGLFLLLTPKGKAEVGITT